MQGRSLRANSLSSPSHWSSNERMDRLAAACEAMARASDEREADVALRKVGTVELPRRMRAVPRR